MGPLQFVPPLGVLGTTVAFYAFALLIVGSMGFLVWRDARARPRARAALWTLGTLLLFPFVVPVYLFRVQSGECGERAVAPTRLERAVGALLAAAVVGQVGGSLLAEPDAFSQVRWALSVFVLVLPLSYLLIYRGWYRRLRPA